MKSVSVVQQQADEVLLCFAGRRQLELTWHCGSGFVAATENHHALVNMVGAGLMWCSPDDEYTLSTEEALRASRSHVEFFEHAVGVNNYIGLLRTYAQEIDDFRRNLGASATALLQELHPILYRQPNHPYWSGWPMTLPPGNEAEFSEKLNWIRMQHRVITKRCADAKKAIKAVKAQIKLTADVAKVVMAEELRYPDLAEETAEINGWIVTLPQRPPVLEDVGAVCCAPLGANEASLMYTQNIDAKVVFAQCGSTGEKNV